MQDNLNKLKKNRLLRQDALKDAYIFICFFVFGPLFGFLAFSLLSEFGRSIWPTMDWMFMLRMWVISLVVGGIQAAIVANVATRSFEMLGFVSFKQVMLKALRVGAVPSAVFVCLLLIEKTTKLDSAFIFVSGVKFLAIHAAAAGASWVCVSNIHANPESGWIEK
ncbi:MAG: hypothetical protein ACRCYS_02515 [Beijerinckiaceae bacterium]